MNLNEFFGQHRKAAIAFSGGCDSAFLCYSARKNGLEFRAYYVKAQFQPEFEYKDALRFAKEYGIDICVISADVLGDENIAANPSNRCYYCKRKVFSGILKKAREDGFDIIFDGTNASDDAGDRPGMKALTEMKVLSPLRICGLTKSDVRTLSKEAGLFTWNKPAYACLATRIPEGTRITDELLRNTEEAEGFLFSLGFSDFRVRYRDGDALLQLQKEQFEAYEKKRQLIEEELGKYYKAVRLDPVPRGASA
ncbi:MAG: ATP-dependent sacrificial sulfur transferase LarE [Lachnospiraceae bacterium]|nr:ATP-dependent sacrificial sulfur transferase LarE [Lachnospiraceae bacterium]